MSPVIPAVVTKETFDATWASAPAIATRQVFTGTVWAFPDDSLKRRLEASVNDDDDIGESQRTTEAASPRRPLFNRNIV